MNEDVRLPYAGFWVRFAATAVDCLILAASQTLVMVPVFGLNIFEPKSTAHSITLYFMTWIVPLVYAVLFWTFLSATPGKILLGLKVVKAKDQSEIPFRD